MSGSDRICILRYLRRRRALLGRASACHVGVAGVVDNVSTLVYDILFTVVQLSSFKTRNSHATNPLLNTNPSPPLTILAE